MKRIASLGALSTALFALEAALVAALLGAFATPVPSLLLVAALVGILLAHHLALLAAVRRARRASREAERVRNIFLVRMSHAIRTPMNGILGTADVLLESRLPREQQDSVATIKDAAETLLSTLTNALEFAKARVGRLDVEIAPFEVAQAVHDAVRSQSARARRKQLELCWEVSADVPERLRGDRRRLQQILRNLVKNAVTHTAEGEVVTRVRLESVTDAHAVLTFEIADTGSGIAVERLEQILASRDDAPALDPDGVGVGLGLPVAAALIERMSGRLSAEARPGGGSVLRFTARLGLEAGAPAWVPPPAAPGLRERSVLVVDDNQSSREILVAELRAWRALPLPAASASEALGILKEAHASGRPPVLALIDLQMPGMPGLILAELLKADPRYRSLPLIALSSGADAEEAEQCRHQGFSAYLTKPALPSDLLEAARRALAAADQPEPATSAAIRPRTRRLRVLVADDNRVDRTLIVRLLEKRGHDVTAVPSGEEAVQACVADGFDLVLMDVQMPHVSGLDATSAIRARERRVGGHLPIIALTADDDSARCLDAGMDAYLAKPVNPHEMVEAIARAVGPDASAAADGEPGEAAPETSRPLDEGAALEQAGGDRSLLVDLAQMCLADAPVALERIRQAIAAEDPAAARRIAQKLRGSLLVLAAEPAARAAQRFDELTAEGGLARASAALAALERTIERLQPALNEIVQPPNGHGGSVAGGRAAGGQIDS